MLGAQTGALQPGPAAGSTNSPAHSLFEAGKFGWGCTRRILRCKPVEQTTSAASSAGPLRIFRHSTASPDASPSARRSLSRRQHPFLLPTLFASNQSRTLTIAGRQGALSCCHSPRQHGQLCPDPQPELVHHPRLVHVHVSSPLPAISLRLLNHALGYRRSARYSTAALATRPAATTPVLPPPTPTPSPQSAAANCHSATPVPSLHRHKIRPPPPL